MAMTVNLMSSDGETFAVDASVAYMSLTVKTMLEDTGADEPVPLPNVTTDTLSKVVEYCKFHVAADRAGQDGALVVTPHDVATWDADFVKVDHGTLFELIMASNFLNIKSLQDLTCQTVADLIKGKTPEQIRQTFNLVNDYTPAEEEAMRRENQWAFE